MKLIGSYHQSLSRLCGKISVILLKSGRHPFELSTQNRLPYSEILESNGVAPRYNPGQGKRLIFHRAGDDELVEIALVFPVIASMPFSHMWRSSG